MTDSQTLLSLYARTGSESAFRELVSRYIDLVYSTAFRLVGGDAQSAQDATQTVFVALAAKAGMLPKDVMLGGWLHQHTRFVAGEIMRTERRRQMRERQAAEMNAIEDHSESNLAQVAPVLDEAIGQLDVEDRTAILLRFFERKDFRSVGEAIGSNEDAARKRVDRALEKLRVLLKHRGVALTTAALGTALATGAVTAAPAGLAGSIAGTALAGAAAGGGITATLVKLMTITKVKMTIVGVWAVAVVATSVVVQHQAQAALQSQDESLRQQSAELARQQAENERLAGLVQAGGSRANTLDELTSIRSEVEALRKQTNSLALSLEENRRLRARNAQQPTGSPSILEAREEERKWAIGRMNYTKQWLLAFIMFADQNHNRFPTSFDEAQPFLPKEAMTETNFTTGQFEILYQGSITNITTPSLTVVLREKQAHRTSDGKWSRAHGFADGHSEITSSPDGNYDAWEKQHIILPPPNR
ncbi:MAG: sigma-70 family RNA polymerase sigma factor [Verrucomicrobiota bacterium]